VEAIHNKVFTVPELRELIIALFTPKNKKEGQVGPEAAVHIYIYI
jgi:hypothetical protein